MTMITDLKMLEEKLKAPFKPQELEFRIIAKSKDNSSGLVAAYIQSRAIQNRLDEVVGLDNWQTTVISDGDAKLCGLSIRINNEWITKYDGAQDTKIESSKGGISNALKRAAVQWGIGRYLYKLPTQWVKIKPEGGSYKPVETPKLPNWALPREMRGKELDFKEVEKIKKQETPKVSNELKKCIEAFEQIGVSEGDLQEYLSLELDMFTSQDIDTLRNVYAQIVIGKKKKEDFFFHLEDERKRGQQTLRLESKLEGA